ncbi:hypothetical protein RI054_36g137830 [Pseudoscourfieldia marina]
MDASVAMAIPGAVVLAGGLRYRARLGKAPVPADLFASSRKAIVSGWSCTLRPCQAIETVEGMKLYDPGASADTTLIRWSAELRAKFTSDNQHLLLPAVSNNAEMALFGGIATDDEVKALKPTRGKENATSSDMGARLVLQEAQRACGGVSRDAYIDAKCPVPPRLQPINQHKLKASSVDFRLGDLKKQRRVAVDLDKSTLRAWRSKHDAKKRGHR